MSGDIFNDSKPFWRYLNFCGFVAYFGLKNGSKYENCNVLENAGSESKTFNKKNIPTIFLPLLCGWTFFMILSHFGVFFLLPRPIFRWKWLSLGSKYMKIAIFSKMLAQNQKTLDTKNGPLIFLHVHVGGRFWWFSAISEIFAFFWFFSQFCHENG